MSLASVTPPGYRAAGYQQDAAQSNSRVRVAQAGRAGNYSSPDRLAVAIGNKGLPLALTLAYLTFFSEFVGAACLAVGLLTRIAAAMIFVQMMVIVIVFQGPYGFFWTNRGYEYPLLWAAFCLAIFFRGGGRWSVDHYIGKEF
jgi:putative oxidoreductase